jgi:acyl-CoA synthetase (NDP forming)
METQCIAMYLEGVRNIPRFRELAAEITKRKPIVALKAGRTESGGRAAQSHTSAMAGRDDIYQGLFDQTNIIRVPSMELLIPMAHAAIELPPMTGNRVGIMTYGGSWGVALTDALEMEGLRVPEFTPSLQQELHDLGLPQRASTKNPVDLGAAGMMSLTMDKLLSLAKVIFTSREVDALILHGLGRPLMLKDGWQTMKLYMDFEKDIIAAFHALQEEYQKPMMIVNHFNIYEAQAVADVNDMGIRVYNRLEDVSRILSRMHLYWKRRNER